MSGADGRLVPLFEVALPIALKAKSMVDCIGGALSPPTAGCKGQL